LLIGCIVVLIAYSCANNEKWNNIHTVNVSAEVKAEKVEKETVSGDTIIVPPYDITVNMEFMDTMTIENADVCRKINNLLIETFLNQKDETDCKKAVDTFISRLQTEYENDDMAPEIYDHYTGKAEYGKEGVINYTLVEDFYGGGAHPTMVTTILRFDANTGEKINLYEFFTDTCTYTLCDKLTQRLMDNLSVPTVDSLHALGYLEMESMFVSENFLLKKDSVSFFYNQYDIAPYAVGCTTISFSYEELKDYIRK